ncbi:MAG: ASCH domain-containing protein [Thermoleophilia bacterium]|nr:ASCH domain-containing protein [Thermoleophilia bacterium]MDH3725457.1 ASCH domain-containing protein [Thermoleophilia bacterium]
MVHAVALEGAVFALNFYSPLFVDQLRKGRKTATIRLGDKTGKYRQGQLVWITVGHRYGPRQKIFTAIIDSVDVKPIRELTQRDIERDNPEFRLVEDTIHFLSHIYSREVTLDDAVSIIHFSEVVEFPSLK